MGIYDKYVLPKLVNLACSQKPTMKQRAKVVPLAEGNVLEIGIGSGLNLPFYASEKVKKVWGVDPSNRMWAMAADKAGSAGFDVEFIEASASDIPLDAQLVDTVLVTYALCTIPEIKDALAEMSRVLKPGGRLLFCEHGAAPDDNIRRWQDRINPVWRKIGGGCNLNRPIPDLLEQAGFKISNLETMYIPGWKPASFNYWGTALAE